ncbi:hypothetical protein DPMN_103196 [Dreissena polymorpha]|uniref:G-protein coupled receptors family 1 profile domain-containing protein n=1 Tax=Dreissena polymorpha TaxID=45954 RepID=A0A9D4H9L3_DREPO|nr:hypothetical protein DPMN_103196 [Dreissena polymorpha]
MEVSHNESMSLNETFDSQAVLQRIHDYLVTSYLPLMIWLGITCVIGVLGNIETIVFYGWNTKASSTKIFITWLAASDLLVCAMMIDQIVELNINVHFSNRHHCKIRYFIEYAGIYSSGILLTIISVDRFRKVCRFSKKQFSIKSTQCASSITVCLCVLFNLRLLFLIDVVDVPVPTLSDPIQTAVVVDVPVPTLSDPIQTAVGHDCSFSKDPDLSTLVFVSHAADFIFLLACLTIMTICYGRLYFHIRKHSQQLSSYIAQARFKNSSDPVMRSITTCQSENASVFHSLGDAERRLTHMMALKALWFVLCYVPYLVLSVFLEFNNESERSFVLRPGVQFALRLPHFNSVINPIVFILLNPQYRSFVRRQVVPAFTGSSLSTSQHKI